MNIGHHTKDVEQHLHTHMNSDVEYQEWGGERAPQQRQQHEGPREEVLPCRLGLMVPEGLDPEYCLCSRAIAGTMGATTTWTHRRRTGARWGRGGGERIRCSPRLWDSRRRLRHACAEMFATSTNAQLRHTVEDTSQSMRMHKAAGAGTSVRRGKKVRSSHQT